MFRVTARHVQVGKEPVNLPVEWTGDAGYQVNVPTKGILWLDIVLTCPTNTNYDASIAGCPLLIDTQFELVSGLIS